MSVNKIVAFNFEKATPATIVRATDDGRLTDKLSDYGYEPVLITPRTFQGGAAWRLDLVDSGNIRPTQIEPRSIAVVRNHVVSTRRDGYLADIPTLNDDRVRSYTRGGHVEGLGSTAIESLLAGWTTLTVPDGVMDTDQRPIEGESPDTVLRAYVVQNGRTRTVVPVVKTPQGFVDVDPLSLPEGVNEFVEDATEKAVRDIAYETQVGRMIGCFGIVQYQGNLYTTRADFGTPEMPMTSEAPEAAGRLNQAVVDTLYQLANDERGN